MIADAPPDQPPATYPGESGSLAATYWQRLHPSPTADELAYRARLGAKLDRA